LELIIPKVKRELPEIFHAWIIAVLVKYLGTYCRGGPPWPPVVLITFTKSEAVAT